MKLNIITFNFISMIVCSLVMSCAGCKDISGYDTRLTIVNNSNSSVYFSDGYSYPDTSIDDYNPSGSFAANGVKPNSSKKIRLNGRWEGIFEDLPADTLMIFIFNADTLDQVPWEKVRSEYKILKRYDLSLQDLKDRDWKIVYP